MSDVGDAEIVLLGPKKRHGAKWFTPNLDVARQRLSLTLGNDKVFDTDAFAAEPIWPPRDITSGKDARGTRLKVFVDDHTTVDSQHCLAASAASGRTPIPTTMKSARSFSPFFSVTVCSSIEVAVVPR